MKVMRTEDEVNDLLNQCVEAEDSGRSKFPGMTYEQGVRNAIDWLTGNSDDNPMAD